MKKEYTLSNNEVHIWTVNLKITKQACCKSKAHKHRCVTSQLVLKKILSLYLNIKSENINLVRNKYGKPQIKKSLNLKNIFFNMSHSNDFMVCAVTINNRNIGIDIERYRSLGKLDHLVKRICSSYEDNWYNYKNEKQFFKLWTHKEAYLKAIGQGIRYGLKKVEFTPASSNKLKLLYVDNQKVKDNWFLYSFKPIKGYISTLVINSKDVIIKNMDYFKRVYSC